MTDTAAHAATFLRGIAIGLALAAPVGPVGLLCIRRALADGRVAAFVAGLGAATADTAFGMVAAYGVTHVSGVLAEQQTWLKLIGGGFLLVLGWRGWRAEAALAPTPLRGPGLVRDFALTLLITLTNPGTIFGVVGVFAALGSGDPGGSPGVLVAGIFAGSAAWWLLLSAAAGAVRAAVTPLWLKRLNQGSGVTILFFGLAVLGSLIFER